MQCDVKDERLPTELWIKHVCLSCPLWNVHIKGHCELKYVEFVVFFFPDGDVRFEVGHNDLRGHSTSKIHLLI